MLLAERKSKQDPPPGVVFDAFVGEQSIWWISVEGEQEPSVIAAGGPGKVIYASAFLWRPHDVIEISVEPHRQGSIVHLRHRSDESFVPLEAEAIRHRWGEHIDRDMRDRFDCGGRPSRYEASLYRGDVADWSIVDRVLDRSWQAVERIPVFSRSIDPGRRQGFPIPNELRAGDIIWAGEMGRHRTSVGCLPVAPPDLENRMTIGSEIFVPLPEFDRRLRAIDSTAQPQTAS
jgi:hypothetical protein